MKKSYNVQNKKIGENEPAFIIAELSANHLGDFEVAKKTIKAISESGADAVKLQTYTADTLTIDSDKEYFKINNGTPWDGRTLYDLYGEAHTPWDWQPKLKKYAEELGLIFFSAPFDKTAVDFLEKLDVPLYKIASFEIKDIPLIEYVASKGKPILFSTGIASIEDIQEVISACKKQNNEQIILLKCTSAYPAKIEDANIVTIKDMQNKFDTLTGLSDHTLGDSVALGAIGIGAVVIEKHFTLDRSSGGPDAKFSMEPSEFKNMVDKIRNIEKSYGQIKYRETEIKKEQIIFSRSLFVVKDIKTGESFTEENVRSIRPGYGMEPKYLPSVIGKKATCNISRGTPLTKDIIENF